MRSIPRDAKRAIAAVTASMSDGDSEILAEGDTRLHTSLQAQRERLRIPRMTRSPPPPWHALVEQFR